MNTNIKIGIVEDELIIAEKIKTILAGIGYEVCEPVTNYDEALEMIISEKPDFLLLDIQLRDSKDGIELAQVINSKFQLPFIFLSANTDGATLERAKEVRPLTFLPKPFTREVLFTTIEMAFNNYNAVRQTQLAPKSQPVKQKHQEYMFVKDGGQFRKVYFGEILFLASEQNYITIHLASGLKVLLRGSLTEMMGQLPTEGFMQIHRAHAIQMALVESLDRHNVVMRGGATVPIGSSYRDELLGVLGIGS